MGSKTQLERYCCAEKTGPDSWDSSTGLRAELYKDEGDRGFSIGKTSSAIDVGAETEYAPSVDEQILGSMAYTFCSTGSLAITSYIGRLILEP
jgi:hypothetical protein